MREMKILAVLTAVAAAVGSWTPVFGSSLYSIGVLNTNLPYSAVRALSQDGTWAAGQSTSAGLYSGGSTQAGARADTNAPVIWSVAGGLQELPDPNGTHCMAYGVDTGIDPTNGLPDIVLSGLHEKQTVSRCYKAPLSSPASGTWMDTADMVRGGCGANWSSAGLSGGFANNLRMKPVGGSGTWFTGANVTSGGRAAMVRGDPYCGGDDSQNMGVWSISGFGVQVGRYTGSSPSTARWSSTSATGDVPGSSGYRADGQGISHSFGTNSTDFANQWVCGQVANYNGTSMQAFRWNRADASMTFLGTFLGDTSSTAYTIADNGVTAGRSYNSTSSDVAAVWDTSGTWDTTGTAMNLKDLLTADGVDTSAWTKLADVYACSKDGSVLAGIGTWAADASTRGFVAVKTAAAPVVQITHISWSSPNVVIDFTSSNLADTTAKFALQQAGTLVNTATVFDVLPMATITGSAGSFQATFAPTANPQFYRIKRLP